MDYLSVCAPSPEFVADIERRFQAGEPVLKYLNLMTPGHGKGGYVVSISEEDLPPQLYWWKVRISDSAGKPFWVYFANGESESAGRRRR